MELSELPPSGAWMISRIVTDDGGGTTTAAMRDHAGPWRAYYPPAGSGLAWALVHRGTPVSVDDADTLALATSGLDAALATIPLRGRNRLVQRLRDAGGAYTCTDRRGDVQTRTALAGDWTMATTWRQVLLDVFAHFAHSEVRAARFIPESHNTEYTDNFDADSSADWTNDGTSAYNRDTTNGEQDGSAWDNDARLRYSANNPGSIEHECQVTGLTNSSTRAVFAGVRMQASPGDAYGVRVQNNGSGAQVLVLSRINAGTRTDIYTSAAFGTLGNFVTVRLAAEGTAGSNVVLDMWTTDHGASKPSDPGWYGTDDSPTDTYTDSDANRLDDAAHLYGGFAGRGPAGAGHDSRMDFWRVRAISDRAAAPTFQAAWAKGANIVIQQRPTP